jgi:hypothetical protein
MPINEARINNIESRLNNIETRLNNLDSHLNNVESHLTAEPAQDVITQLRPQLDRIEQGGRRNFFAGGLALSVAAMIFATNLLTTNPTSIPGIILAVLGIFLAYWSSLNLFRRQ